MLKGFRDFLLRGNVVELAVAFVVGAAFTALVNSVVTNIFNPLIGAIFQAKSLDSWAVVSIPLVTGTANLSFGTVIGAIITFVITAAVAYFCFVLPLNALAKKTAGKAEAAPTDTELLAEIRDLLKQPQSR